MGRVLATHRGGIIPARAGFTIRRRPTANVYRDHPRSRGVYPDSDALPYGKGGIIPARAGFTCPRPSGRSCRGDHPRSRGVYPARSCRGTTTPGSSPLARGLQFNVPDLRGRFRIIPARAGFTHWGAPSTGALTDHPRSRGVYPLSPAAGSLAMGSSPLARGLQRLARSLDTTPGIIPARAGFTMPPGRRGG